MLLASFKINIGAKKIYQNNRCTYRFSFAFLDFLSFFPTFLGLLLVWISWNLTGFQVFFKRNLFGAIHRYKKDQDWTNYGDQKSNAQSHEIHIGGFVDSTEKTNKKGFVFGKLLSGFLYLFLLGFFETEDENQPCQSVKLKKTKRHLIKFILF